MFAELFWTLRSHDSGLAGDAWHGRHPEHPLQARICAQKGAELPYFRALIVPATLEWVVAPIRHLNEQFYPGEHEHMARWAAAWPSHSSEILALQGRSAR